MKEDFETGLFHDQKGNVFIKNEFDPDNPVYIKVEDGAWSCVANGQSYYCDWTSINEFPELSLALKEISKEKLSNNNGPSYINNVHQFLKKILETGKKIGIDFNKDFSTKRYILNKSSHPQTN